MGKNRKEAYMIIDINKPFTDYQPLELISYGNCAYRQVYKALDCEGNKVFLTVYDNDKKPKSLQGETVKEFNIVYNMTNEVFPRHIGTGAATYEGRTISFMSTAFFDFITLRDAVEGRVLKEKDVLNIAYHLLIGLKELLYYTQGGGHFNICPDTVVLSKGDDGEYKPHIIGMEHASMASNGNPDFDTITLNQCFRAPESFLGKFSPASDVYSMGMLMAYMLQGKYPFDITESMPKSEILKVIHRDKPQLNASIMPELIIEKAISKNAAVRYKNVEELGIAIMNIMGFEKPKNFSCFSGGKKKRRIDQREDGANRIGGDHCRLSHSVQEPRINVDMNVRTGEGFQAVAGMEDIKRRLKRDFIDIVFNKELAKEFDILPPNMLFYGPPGTGKTYLSMRLAEECGLEFSVIKPSDLASIWVHGSQSLIRKLFDSCIEKAKKNERGCLLLLDEVDSVIPMRTVDNNDHQAGEVAEFLTQLNDCVEKNVYVIGTTNFIDRIDKAAIRKGRIDEVFYIGMPDIECRRQIFDIEIKKRPHEEDIDIELLSKMTEGYTSGDISYVVKESARNSFEASIKNRNRGIVKISQTMIEEVIRETKPSVSADEVRRYEKMRDEYVIKGGKEKRRIGFIQ